MSYYRDVLVASHLLLVLEQEDYWVNWIKKSIDEWVQQRSVNTYLSLRAGMGSFYDLSFAGENSWQRNKLLDIFQNITYFLALFYRESGEVGLEKVEEKLIRDNTLLDQKLLLVVFQALKDGTLCDLVRKIEGIEPETLQS